MEVSSEEVDPTTNEKAPTADAVEASERRK